MSCTEQMKKQGIFLYLLFVRRKFFNICVLSQCIVYWIHFQNIHTFTYQKTLLHTLFCLSLKSWKAFSLFLILIWSLITLKNQDSGSFRYSSIFSFFKYCWNVLILQNPDSFQVNCFCWMLFDVRKTKIWYTQVAISSETGIFVAENYWERCKVIDESITKA